MLWLYDIKMCFILICVSYAKMEPIIKELSPSLLLTDSSAEEDACDVTARDQRS